MEDYPNRDMSFLSFAELVDGIKSSGADFLETEIGQTLSQREEIYALYAVLIEEWWTHFTQLQKFNNAKIHPLRNSADFLQKPHYDASIRFQKSAEKWLKDKLQVEYSLCQAAIQRVSVIRTSQDGINNDENVFLNRFNQGLLTGLDHCFKLPVLVWNLHSDTNISKNDFIALVVRSKGVTNFFASTQLQIAMRLDQYSEKGDSSEFYGLEGYHEILFQLDRTRSTPLVKVKRPESQACVHSLIAQKKIYTNNKSSVQGSVVGCPAMHVKVITPMLTMAAEYFWECIKASPNKSGTDRFAEWMEQQGI